MMAAVQDRASPTHPIAKQSDHAEMSPIAINGNHADVAVNGHNDHLEAKARVTNKVKPVSLAPWLYIPS